jgi:light-harvesting complex I chlorophyll a/b binding protein 3
MDRRWLVTSEVLHGRWAMLGAMGCLVPEMLGRRAWFQTGWLPPADAAGAGDGEYYWADTSTLFAIQVVFMGAVEACRLQDYVKPGSMAEPLQVLLPDWSGLAGGFAGSGAAAYPGGPVFNYFNYVTSSRAMGHYKEAEIKHGRLAMVAMLGFGAQAVLTGQGPWANLMSHVDSPVDVNVLSSLGSGMSGEPKAELDVVEVVEDAAATAFVAAGTVLGLSLMLAL